MKSLFYKKIIPRECVRGGVWWSGMLPLPVDGVEVGFWSLEQGFHAHGSGDDRRRFDIGRQLHIHSIFSHFYFPPENG